jgi:hypothetical protein
MLHRIRRQAKNGDKPDDEKQIELDAYKALRESRKQMHRASGILQDEVVRIDKILSKGARV